MLNMSNLKCKGSSEYKAAGNNELLGLNGP